MRRWLVMAVAVPVGVWILAEVADELAHRHGESHATRLLRLPKQVHSKSQPKHKIPFRSS